MLLFGHGASWLPLLGGIVGAVMMVLVFDWALIVLSALAGARAVLLPFGLEGPWEVVAWLVLAAVGVAYQSSRLAPAALPQRDRRSPS